MNYEVRGRVIEQREEGRKRIRFFFFPCVFMILF